MTGESIAFGLTFLGHFLGLGIIVFGITRGQDIDWSWLRPGEGRGPGGGGEPPASPKRPDAGSPGFALPLDDADPHPERLREPRPIAVPTPARRGTEHPDETRPRKPLPLR